MGKTTNSKTKSSSKSNSKKEESKSSNKGSVKVSKKDAKKVKKSEAKDDSSKFNRFANVEKGDAPNKHTSYINGYFNVNEADNYMKSYIADTLELDISCISTKFPFSATVESLMHHLTLTAAQYAQKDSKKANLYIITAENLQRAVRENPGYGRGAKVLVTDYDPMARNYAANFYLPIKNVKKFIENRTTLNKNNVQVTSDALNFMCYFTEIILCDITRTACRMARVNKKKSVGIKHFVAAAEDHLTGEAGHAVARRLDEVVAIFENKNGKDDDDDDNDSEKTDKKKNKKEASKKKEESGNESDDADDKSDDDDDESDDADDKSDDDDDESDDAESDDADDESEVGTDDDK